MSETGQDCFDKVGSNAMPSAVRVGAECFVRLVVPRGAPTVAGQFLGFDAYEDGQGSQHAECD